MDYYPGDRFFLPPGQFESQFTEKIVYLPANSPYLPIKDAPPVNRLPALSNGHITFGSFNRPNKLSPSVISLWAKLLQALPSSRMLLGGMPEEGSCDALVKSFEKAGVARERLSVHARCSMDAYLKLHQQVDICLDTFPYNGGTTTLLLESEMFGYVKGAFTGADRDKPGRFQEADGGTIFLDEIGDLPLPLQAKLLRVLEDREFYPLGSRRTTKVDVRIIAATNQEMERLVREKHFREDLYYRLNVIRIELPELKARKADLSLLISHILKRLSVTRNTRIEKISEDAMEVLLNYDYPGNIRELENILEHAFTICQGTTIERSTFLLPH